MGDRRNRKINFKTVSYSCKISDLLKIFPIKTYTTNNNRKIFKGLRKGPFRVLLFSLFSPNW